MDMQFTPEQISTYILAFFLIVKGLMNEMNKRKAPERGCLMGDQDHANLNEKLDHVLKNQADFRDFLIEIKTRGGK